ncbi:rhodanese-related sulfurtransferase [Granulicella cerasi]|uniref:tRNA uridine(34) hydroxylase n=1 Tax=Granulicella cerasi TaxID=741063 RepID=A0ABW1ZA96_9BACT|nr:rhodanese-related sulfurtransferase [Granulicella cerasi]
MPYTVAALYKFVTVEDPAALREALAASFVEGELLGTILIATEGVNGTVAAADPAVIDRLLAFLHERLGLDRAEVKFSSADDAPFGRLKFKVKNAVLTFRGVEVDPNRPGTYVEAADWNALLADPEVLLVDTRNDYEVEAGTFQGAIDPHLTKFSEFVDYTREHLDATKHKKVAMFCTGGIRCEKASAYLLQQGFENVYHLRGGILKYLEDIPTSDSLWQGDCFVFDRRRGVGHDHFEEGE